MNETIVKKVLENPRVEYIPILYIFDVLMAVEEANQEANMNDERTDKRTESK